MINQFINSLNQYAQARYYDVKKGLYSASDANDLLNTYSDSMIRGMCLIGKEYYIGPIQRQTNHWSRVISPSAQLPHHIQLSLHVSPLLINPTVTRLATIRSIHINPSIGTNKKFA